MLSFQEVTHGLALKLKDQAALNYLNNREVTLGGYVSHITLFYPRDKSRPPFPILLYIATPTNRHWLGPAPLDDVAEQVIFSPPRGRWGDRSSYYGEATCNGFKMYLGTVLTKDS